MLSVSGQRELSGMTAKLYHLISVLVLALVQKLTKLHKLTTDIKYAGYSPKKYNS